MNTDPAQFKRLLEIIPPEIMSKVWFFPLPLGKKFPPACKDAQDEKNRLTPQQGLDRLNKGLNVGIYCLPGGLFIIDEDRENGAFVIPDEVRATFPKTLTIQTRNAGCQYYYKNNGTFNNKIYKFGGIKAGELRANWYYGVAPGSYVKPDDNAGQDATGLYSIINGVSVSPLEKIPAWMEVCEDIPKEKIKIEIENEITWKNDLGMPLYEIRKKSQKLDALLNGANEADRSAADMAAVQLLYFWRFTDSEISRILQEYRAYEKIARQDYIETTISKIIRGERYNPNYKSNGNGKEALENKTPAIEVDTVEDIPIPIEDKIPPISFDGLWEYSYHNFFKDYVASMSDGYPEYAFQNGTATLSTLSRRRLYIRLNGRTEYMNLITLSLGQSGYARKGSAFSAAQRFLRTAVGDTFLSPDLTPEGMISEIADTITTIKKTKSGLEEVKEEKQHGRIRKAVCAWWKDEAGQLYAQLTKPYMQSFKEQICNFYDSPEQYDKGQSSKQIHIGAISLGMNLATTPESFTRSVVNGDIATGFLARHNIVNPAYVKERKPLKEDTEEDMLMEVAFGEMLKIIDKLIPDKPVRVRIDEDTLKMYDNWCKDREEYFAKERNEGMGSFFARFQINVLKTAALLDLGNIPASLYLYKNGVDNSQVEKKIIIRHREIISKNPPLLSSNSIHVPNIISILNNTNISDYNISSLSISKSSLLFVMNLYDTMFIPYAYQICVNSKVDLFANYLTNIYKNLSDKKKMERSDLMRMSHVSKRAEFDEAIETLKEAGAVIEYRFKGVTKPKTVYVYVPSPYAKLNFPQADNSKYAENGFFELTIKENVSPTPTEQSYLNNIVRDKIERKGKEYQEKKESSINSLNMDEFVFCFCDQFKDTDPAEIAILVKQIYGIPQVEQVIA